jgi:hypothetical protein
LWRKELINRRPQPVFVIHDRYGGGVGNLPSYDTFTLGGGGYCVRGYNRYILQKTVCRRFLIADEWLGVFGVVITCKGFHHRLGNYNRSL